MQTGRGRRHGTALTRENRLVALAIGETFLPFDVRRKRNVAETVHGGVDVLLAGETNGSFAAVALFHDFGRESLIEANGFSHRKLAPGPHQSFPFTAGPGGGLE